jgi:hypothetical protein
MQRHNSQIEKWPNTMVNIRKKREADRIKQLEEEESKRREQDAEMDAIADDDRQKALMKANKHMHDNQDMVKGFHSKMIICDVNQEREQQKLLQKKKQEIQADIEKQWHAQELKQMDEYDSKMRSKMEQEYKVKQQNAKVIKKQLHEFKINHIK